MSWEADYVGLAEAGKCSRMSADHGLEVLCQDDMTFAGVVAGQTAWRFQVGVIANHIWVA